jgi:hypothetical protein
MRTVKWGVDWMLKAHFNASDVPSLNQLVVQVGGAGLGLGQGGELFDG